MAAVALAVLMTWPLAREARDHVPSAVYYWDAYTTMMIMGSHADALVGRGPLSLHDVYYFAPLPNSIVFNENLFGLSLIFAPLYLISQSPLLAYNLTLLISLSLSAFFTYLLVRRLTGNGFAGALAGVAFAFSPYVMFELGRIQLVATQWIPACFLMLHGAVEKGRWRDAIGFWLCYLLQIGTCLYYAMFLIPLLGLVAAVEFARHRPAPRLYARLAVVGAAAAVVAFVMVEPYFTARDTFALERSPSFASSYDGKLSFFLNVPETNLTLTGMRHRADASGAHEEIAFPGFTVLGLLVLSLGVPVRRAVPAMGPRRAGALALRWLAVVALVTLLTVLAHSMLAGAVALALCVWHEARHGRPVPFSGRRGLCLALVLLSLVMFLGLTPFEWRGAPVRGLYYYFYTYVPGFDGMRKVSRQAVMTTFALVLLSSFGGAWLFSQLGRLWLRAVVLCALVGATCYELRSFPHPMQGVWAGAAVPEAYRFVARLPPRDLVATVPNGTGTGQLAGEPGRALHNYLMLFHKHRSLLGQSSYVPPVTDLIEGALSHLPDDGARRILESVGARYLLVHGEELEPSRRVLPEALAAEPEHFQRVFQQGAQSVFALSAADDDVRLADTPSLPPGARALPASALRADADLGRDAALAVDDNLATFWSAPGPQVRGQRFEMMLAQSHRIVAFEIDNPLHVTDVPLSFELSVARDASAFQTVVEEPALRLYRDQIESPKTFVFRIVLPTPTWADRIRITIAEPVPGQNFVIHEARLYEAP